MIKFIILLLAISSGTWFINYKFSKAVRIMAYGEGEEPSEAKTAMFVMCVSVLLWSIYLSLFV